MGIMENEKKPTKFLRVKQVAVVALFMGIACIGLASNHVAREFGVGLTGLCLTVFGFGFLVFAPEDWTVRQMVKEMPGAFARLGSLLAYAALLGIVGAILLYIFSERYRYVIRYSVLAEHVILAPKPTDCDWGHSPLGDKDCHYEKKIIFKLADGELVSNPSTVPEGWVRVQTQLPPEKLRGLRIRPSQVTDVYTEWVRVVD